jgi:hypothetical protein
MIEKEGIRIEVWLTTEEMDALNYAIALGCDDEVFEPALKSVFRKIYLARFESPKSETPR